MRPAMKVDIGGEWFRYAFNSFFAFVATVFISVAHSYCFGYVIFYIIMVDLKINGTKYMLPRR